MASHQDFVEYVAEQIGGAGDISWRKMFGEYGVYCSGKIIGLICDDTFFVKITEAGKKLCPELAENSPYEGAKPYLQVEDLDNRELLAQLVTVTWAELPEPKPKKKRKSE